MPGLLGGLALLGGLLSFVVNTFIGGYPELQTQLAGSFSSSGCSPGRR